jgi:hypothetical protein
VRGDQVAARRSLGLSLATTKRGIDKALRLGLLEQPPETKRTHKDSRLRATGVWFKVIREAVGEVSEAHFDPQHAAQVERNEAQIEQNGAQNEPLYIIKIQKN